MQIALKNTMKLSVVALFALAACGGAAGMDENEDDATAAKSQMFVFAPDNRTCNMGACSGRYVTALKSNTKTLVDSIDYSKSGVSASMAKDLNAAALGEVVLYGTIDSKKVLNVTAAYRGMPGQTAQGNDAFYTVTDGSAKASCTAASCDTEYALNRITGEGKYFSSPDVTGAMVGLADAGWMTEQVRNHGALTAGKMKATKNDKGATQTILTANQVFAKLPVTQVCPEFKMAACPSGQTRAYARDANRCLVPAACVVQSVCPMNMRACSDGYTLASWPGANGGCPQYACDPTWSVQ